MTHSLPRLRAAMAEHLSRSGMLTARQITGRARREAAQTEGAPDGSRLPDPSRTTHVPILGPEFKVGCLRCDAEGRAR